MNKFLIAISALLAVSRFCDAYGPSPVYSAPAAAAVYQLKPTITLQVLVPASYNAADLAYGAKERSQYGAPLRSAYGGPIGLSPPSYRRLAPVGYDSEILRLAELALSLPSLPAIINPDPALLPSKVYAPAAPLILPASSINGGYKVPAYPPKSTSVSAIAPDYSINSGYNDQSAVAPVRGYIAGPVPNNAYVPVRPPIVLPAPVPLAGY